ncbi:type II secretion system protein GspG [Formosa sp. S-31]|uniref:type II secretion system protein GspG n=1 Tax=Formosa sp. S-31 TaxID=2790949 RepID=UPI003EB899E2
MIELILSLLAEFGLYRQDYKHRKRINEKEKADGNKRPFQKYILLPSSLLLITVFVLGNICMYFFFKYQNTHIYPEKTKTEMAEISRQMNKWFNTLGKYPNDLNELIGNNPNRQAWRKDFWNHPYKFTVTKDRKDFLIISAGHDAKFGTKDDITSE